MNIFALDLNPEQAAQWHVDKHVVKMLLESAQLLITAFPPGTTPYKHTHVNHPCAKWARASLANYAWLLEHARALCDEYTKRYGKVHKSEEVIASLDRAPSVPDGPMTPFEDPVKAYRAYYVSEKARFARWAPRAEPPEWWPFAE